MHENEPVELEPCPFCEGQVAVQEFNPWEVWHIVCDNCGVQSHEFFTANEAVEWWNHRPIEDALRAEIECLKEQETLIAVEATELRTALEESQGANSAYDTEIRLANAALDEARLALESLTPQGSEFVGDIPACVEWIKQNRSNLLSTIKRFKRDRDAARAEVSRLENSAMQLENEKEDLNHEWTLTHRQHLQALDTIAALRAQAVVRDGLLKDAASELVDAIKHWGSLDDEERIGTVDEALYQIESALTAAPSPLAVVEGWAIPGCADIWHIEDHSGDRCESVGVWRHSYDPSVSQPVTCIILPADQQPASPDVDAGEKGDGDAP